MPSKILFRNMAVGSIQDDHRPPVTRGRYEKGAVTCVWNDSPETVQAAQRFAEALIARDPGSWTIAMDRPVANA